MKQTSKEPNYSLHKESVSNKSKSKIILLFILLSFVFSFTATVKAQEINFDVKNYRGGYNVSCNGSSDGVIDAIVFGGTKPYTYVWSNGATTQDIANIPAGSYTLTVTDAAAHVVSKTVTLKEPDLLDLFLYPSVYAGNYNISKQGGNDGSIKTDIKGGTPPYKLLWNTGSHKDFLDKLIAGTYSVTITDQNNCTVTKSITLLEPTPLQIVSITAANHNGYGVSCADSKFGNPDLFKDGSITLVVSGAMPPYSFLWSNGSFEQNPNKLPAGDYKVRVLDANKVEVDGQITITQPPKIILKLITSSYPNGFNISCNGCANGTITTQLTGGVSPYTYIWKGKGNANGSTSANLSNMSPGDYYVQITDANGCNQADNTFLYEPQRDDWALFGNTVDGNNNYIGSNNQAPLVFKTNSTTQMTLGANGGLQVNSLAGTNNRLLEADANGVIKPITMGTSSQVLLGDGTLGTLPVIPPTAPSVWTKPDSNIYYNFGNVGIGTTNPQYKLDINGDVNISNDLYVGGGVIITDRVNAADRVTTNAVKSRTMTADSIMMDSSKAVYGTTNFNDKVFLKNKLSVAGDANFTGSLMVQQGLKFDNSNGISYINDNGTRTFTYGAIGGTPPKVNCAAAPNPPYVHNFGGGFQVYEADYTTGQYIPNGGLLNLQAWQGASSIDASNGGLNGVGRLLINYFCGNSTFINTGAFGGDVQICSQTLGKVGIGTSSPSAKLDVNGNLRVASLSPGGIVQADPSGTLSTVQITLTELGLWHLSTSGTGIYNITHNVGIGTNDPHEKLDINGGNIIMNGNQIYLGWDHNHGLSYYNTYAGKTIDGPVLYGYSGGALGTINQGSGTQNIALNWDLHGNVNTTGFLSVGGSDFVLGLNDGRPQKTKTANRALVHDGWESGWDNLVINYDGDFEDGVHIEGPQLLIDGNVGIGTNLVSDPTNAPYKLCVNGFMRAKKVVVETSWSDFVFEKNYKLSSLAEVEKYIKENGHLSEIPSAKEIEKNGGDLGELVKIQMQKIEELTLYIIEQNKRIEALEKK